MCQLCQRWAQETRVHRNTKSRLGGRPVWSVPWDIPVNLFGVVVLVPVWGYRLLLWVERILSIVKKKRILYTRNNRRYPHTGTIATTPNTFTGMSQKRSFSIVIVSLSSTLILSLPWALVVSPGVGRKTCPLEFRKRWRQPKVIHLKERKGNTFQGVCHSVWPTGTILPPKTEIVPVFETLSSYP